MTLTFSSLTHLKANRHRQKYLWNENKNRQSSDDLLHLSLFLLHKPNARRQVHHNDVSVDFASSKVGQTKRAGLLAVAGWRVAAGLHQLVCALSS